MVKEEDEEVLVNGEEEKVDDDRMPTVSHARTNNVLFRRKEQLERWQDSETNKQTPKSKERRKVKFPEGCVFLAACASGDEAEVEEMLEEGVNINTANVDGLTALHQSVIDENIDMVQFLLEQNAQLNAQDNEGWTALHAAVSCGFKDIVLLLLDKGADLTILNNDGELAIDLCEDEEMKSILRQEINSKNLDLEKARHQEEELLMNDAMEWARTKQINEKVHPRTGATALHVAASKGYIRVMNLLIQAGADLGAQDNDGWTPLHAAAHWGERQACEVLAEAFSNFSAQDYSGLTPLDIADEDMISFLMDLKNKQVQMSKTRKHITPTLIEHIEVEPANVTQRRKNSVTRMSNEEKHQLTKKDEKTEGAILKSASSSEEASDFEWETAKPSKTYSAKPLLPTTPQSPPSATNDIPVPKSRRKPPDLRVDTGAKIPKLDTSPGKESPTVKSPAKPTLEVVPVSQNGSVHPSVVVSPAVTAPTSSAKSSTSVSSTQANNAVTVSVSDSSIANRLTKKTDPPSAPPSYPPKPLTKPISPLATSSSAVASSGGGDQHSPHTPSWRLTGRRVHSVNNTFSPPLSPSFVAGGSVGSAGGVQKSGSVGAGGPIATPNALLSSSSTSTLPLTPSPSATDRGPPGANTNNSQTMPSPSVPNDLQSPRQSEFHSGTTSTTSTITDDLENEEELPQLHQPLWSSNYPQHAASQPNVASLVAATIVAPSGDSVPQSAHSSGLAAASTTTSGVKVPRLRLAPPRRPVFLGHSSSAKNVMLTPPLKSSHPVAERINKLLGSEPNLLSPIRETISTVQLKSFTPPYRLESESERKAHSRKERKERRSTQGVTMEQLRSAGEFFTARDPEQPASARPDISTERKTSLQSPISTVPSTSTIPTSSSASTSSTGSSGGGKRPEGEGKEGASGHVPPWRSQALESAQPKTPTTSVQQQQQQQSSTDKALKPVQTGPSLLVAGITRAKPVQIISTTEEESGVSGKEEKNTAPIPNATPSANTTAYRRRTRNNRRSTGPVVQQDIENLEKEEEEERREGNAHAPPSLSTLAPRSLGVSRLTTSLSGYTNRYPGLSNGTGPGSEKTSSRASSVASIGSSLNSDSDLDYKLLYEKERAENEKLQNRITDLEDRLKALEKPSSADDNKKEIEKLRSDNQRLKDENGALIRVISKLSK